MDRLQLQPSQPTVYVQADLSNFKELVQRLTGQQQPPPATVASAATAEDDTPPETVAAATGSTSAAAPRRGSITERRMSTAIQNKPAPATVASGASAAPDGRGSITVRRISTAVENKLAFKPKLPVIKPARARLAAAASPSPSPAAQWGPDGPCVLNKQVELPPSPPSASTLAEEVDVTKQKGRQEMYHQSPARAVMTRPEPKLLTLFPLTSSYSNSMDG